MSYFYEGNLRQINWCKEIHGCLKKNRQMDIFLNKKLSPCYLHFIFIVPSRTTSHDNVKMTLK